MSRKSPALPAGSSPASKYATQIRPGVWRYTSGPTKGRFAPTRNGLPFLPGWRKDSAGRAYNVAERKERATRTIQAPTRRGKVKASKASYSRRFGISPLGGLRTVYAPDADQLRIQELQAEFGVDYWDGLLEWAAVTFAKGALTNGRGWLIVGQSGKASHWRSYTARWGQDNGWQIIGSAITQPDVEKAVDSGQRLTQGYGSAGPSAPDEEEPEDPLPTPSIALSIPVKRISTSRWEKLTK
jgi:hypothetical protein